MVSYAPEEDFRIPKSSSKYRTAAEKRAQIKARNAARSAHEWEKLATDIVYRQLAMAERATGQLRATLSRREVPSDIAENVISKFITAGLVDDARYAQMYVRTTFSGKTTSRRKLSMELSKRGLTSEVIESALEQISEADEFDAAYEFALKKIKTLSQYPRDTIYRRVYGAMGRRGFSPSTIRNAMERAFSEIALSRVDL